MLTKLHYNTVTPILLDILKDLMQSEQFEKFRLVGGTALSLQRGHRVSVDIDLFTDEEYGTIDFLEIDSFFKKNYTYVETSQINIISFGKSYYIGKDKDNCIKIDLYYTDKFIEPQILVDGIRLASINEIISIKIDVINRVGRKKEFWDIHELIENYSPSEMFSLHKKRHPYKHSKTDLKIKFSDFKNADSDFDPICLSGKHWEFISKI